MSAVVLILVGAVLCFFGVASVHLGILAAGFGLGWFLGQLFDAGTSTSLLVGAGCALLCWLLATFVFRVAAFFLGSIVGAVIGARLYALLSGDDTSILLALVFVPSVAVVVGLLANRYRERALLWATAFGGASIILAGVAAFDDDLDALQQPEGTGQVTAASALWVGIALLGWWVQRRLFARRLGLRRGGDGDQRR